MRIAAVAFMFAWLLVIGPALVCYIYRGTRRHFWHAVRVMATVILAGAPVFGFAVSLGYVYEGEYHAPYWAGGCLLAMALPILIRIMKGVNNDRESVHRIRFERELHR
jgi:peptidoglycan/LPS O-acetylase OafA/YrhL